jgi:dienelactone hydrolase
LAVVAPGRADQLESAIRVQVDIAAGRAPGAYDLEGYLVLPSAIGRAPLALIAHGTPRDPAARRRDVRAYNYAGIAREFAQFGWASAVVLRRGYGSSQGEFVEGIQNCTEPGYVEAGQETASELAAIAAALLKRPDIEPRILLVGLGTGAFGALAADRTVMPGLTAVINFSGGNGSLAPFRVCAETELIDALHNFGARHRRPTLWLYAEDDSYFAPILVGKMLSAYRRAGGRADLTMYSVVGRDGHAALFFGRPDLWRAKVSRFLANLPPL